MRLIEIRLLEGPNVYRLEPVVKIELALGRRRTFYGERRPARHALVRLGATVPAKAWPDPIAAIVAWVRRLRTDHGDGLGGIAVHRSSDPGHWIITFPWTGAERAQSIAEASLALAERDVSPSRTARLTGHQERVVARWSARIEEARTTPPSWIRDADRQVPIVSISGTNGKSTVTRLITHILVTAGKRVGTTTSDGVLLDERIPLRHFEKTRRKRADHDAGDGRARLLRLAEHHHPRAGLEGKALEGAQSVDQRPQRGAGAVEGFGAELLVEASG